MMEIANAVANGAKASFDSIYVEPDPRGYYSTLGSLDYAIPDLARPMFRQIVAAWREQHGRAPTILDLGCSYGVNAALLQFPLSFDMLRRRYSRPEILTLQADELARLDKHYFQSWPRIGAERLIGLDASKSALAYALQVGLFEAGIAEDLEEADPSREAKAILADVDIVISTGCVGYVTQKTFARLAAHIKRPFWTANFVLRMFDYAPIAETLAALGLETEKLVSASFVQRRFRDSAEASSVMDLIHQRGLNPAGMEADGFMMAELFLSRPASETCALQLNDIVNITSGRNMSFGPRLVSIGRGAAKTLASVR